MMATPRAAPAKCQALVLPTPPTSPHSERALSVAYSVMAMGAEYCALPGLGVLGGLGAPPGVEDGEDNFLG